MRRSLLSLSVSLAFFGVLGSSARAQINQVGPYSARSFEAPRFPLGPLAGHDMNSQPDGWMLFDANRGLANLQAALVQSSLVRSGAQAVKWDAAQMDRGTFGELRRNALFDLTTGVIEIEFDFYLASSANPSGAWGLYTQPAPHPQTAQLWWEIDRSNELRHCSTSSRQWIRTGVFVARDRWHHVRSVVDIAGDRTAIFLDGVLVATGRPCGVYANLPAHGFTQLTVTGAGDDALYLDNFTTRERTAEHGLSVDLERVRVGRRAVLGFRIAGDPALGGSSYALLGTLSGTTPGVALGAEILPLVPDTLFLTLLGALGSPALPGFTGQLAPHGTAYATFDTQVPIPVGMAGLTAHFAWFTYQPSIAVSEPVAVRFIL